MATKQPTKNGAAQTDDDLPGDWERIDDAELPYPAREGFKHPSGLEVTVEDDAWPDQMADARSSRRDTGSVARVRDGNVSAQLTADLAAESVAREVAQEFVATYPDGGFDVPAPADQPFAAPVEWRDE